MLAVFILFSKAFGQHHISKYEKRWAFFHPIAAFKIRYQLPQAMKLYQQVKASKDLDTLESGGKLDAFRHTFVMAYLARSVKRKKLLKLGIAHEKGNKLQFEKGLLENHELPDSLACEMDLRNNQTGIDIGVANKKLNGEELKVLVIKEIKAGKAWYLKRNAKFDYVTCANQAINLMDYKGKWYVPKCLIKTNE